MQEERVRNCKCCGQPIEELPRLSYHNMPALAQNFPTEKELAEDQGIDLDIYQCQFCGLIQLLQSPVYYYKDVIRAVAVSDEMKEFRKEYFQNYVSQCCLRGKKVVEIGAGCGEYMEMLLEHDVDVYGLEHLKDSVEVARQKGLNVREGFLDEDGIIMPEAPFDAFYIMNFLEHVPEPLPFLKTIVGILKTDAYGLIEVPNGDAIIKGGFFSEFMLDHQSYFSKETLRTMLSLAGFEVISCEVIWHEYIISAIVKRRNLFETAIFGKKQEKLISDINEILNDAAKDGKGVAIWGAGHEALAVMALADIRGKVECVIDSAWFKQGKYTPTTHIPIYSPDIIMKREIGVILVMCGSFSHEVDRMIKEKYPMVETHIFMMQKDEE